MTANPSFVAREAERMAQNAAPFQATLLNYLALGCMFMMAFPCAAQALKAVKELVSDDRHESRQGDRRR